jgi:Phytanoyl-CoA dioxygenase (PhyH)
VHERGTNGQDARTGVAYGADMPIDPADIHLDADAVSRYCEDGFWISPVLFDAEEVAALRREVVRVLDGERDFDSLYWEDPPAPADGLALRQVCNAWWVNRRLREVVRTPALGAIGAALMGTDEVRVWHDQVLLKPGRRTGGGAPATGNVGWHQDYAYWRCANTMNMCTAWIALQDTEIANGAMRMVRGSHRWGLVEGSATFDSHDLDDLRDRHHRAGRDWSEVPCVLRAGQVSFHHALTLHGSGPNTSGAPRLSIVVHLMPSGCGYTQHLPPAEADARFFLPLGPDVREGQPYGDPWYPLVWPAAA